jgi:hypothetical protein
MQLAGFSKFAELDKEVKEVVEKVVKRRKYKYAQLRLNESLWTMERNGDLSTFVFAVPLPNHGVYAFGIGSSKRSMYDPDVENRGFGIAAGRAVDSLDLALFVEEDLKPNSGVN